MTLDWIEGGVDREAVSLGWRADGGGLPEHTYSTDPMYYLDGLTVGEVALPEPLAAIPPAVLLDLVEQGQTVRILRHGKPVADLVPVRAEAAPPAWKQAIEPARLEPKDPA